MLFDKLPCSIRGVPSVFSMRFLTGLVLFLGVIVLPLDGFPIGGVDIHYFGAAIIVGWSLIIVMLLGGRIKANGIVRSYMILGLALVWASLRVLSNVLGENHGFVGTTLPVIVLQLGMLSFFPSAANQVNGRSFIAILIIPSAAVAALNIAAVLGISNFLLVRGSGAERLAGIGLDVGREIAGTSTFGVYGQYLVTGLVFSFVLLHMASRYGLKIIGCLAALLFITGIVLSQSRSTWLAGMTSLLAYSIFSSLVSKRIKAIVFMGFGIALLSLIPLMVSLDVKTVAQRLDQFSAIDRNFDKIIWVGMGDGDYSSATGDRHGIHNTFLQQLWRSGLFGFLAFVGVFLVALSAGIKKRGGSLEDRIVEGAVAALAGVLVEHLLFPGDRRFMPFLLIGVILGMGSQRRAIVRVPLNKRTVANIRSRYGALGFDAVENGEVRP